METGESGANGAHVVRRVNKVNSQENVNATHRLRSMEEINVMDTLAKIEFATKMFRVQVTYIKTFIFATFMLRQVAHKHWQHVNLLRRLNKFL